MDLDDDQKRNITYRVTGTGAALLEGQDATPETVLWTTPLPPDREAERVGEPEVIFQTGDGVDDSGG